MRVIKRIILPSLLALACAVPALAMTATQKVEREVTVTQEDGTEIIKREKADMVLPGERIVYTIDYLNNDALPATDLELVMPVPAEITYIEGSAEAENAVVKFSTDGGESFTIREDVTVKMADGKTRKAAARDITHIRWELQSVGVGENGSLSFKGTLK